MHPDSPVEALMTRQPVTVMPSDSVGQAMALLERYPFRHLPVVDANRLVGMVSDRDLAFAIALPRGPRSPGHGARAPRMVEEILRAPVRSVAPTTPARAAVELMLEHRIGALPVVSDGELLGIVTETDVLRLLERCDLCLDSDDAAAASVEACMKQPVQTAAPDDDLLDAAGRLHDSVVRHLPVVKEKELLGMLSDRDVRRGLARLIREDKRVEAEGSSRIPRLRVEDVMSTPCLTIQRDRPLRAAARTMLENRIGALVVRHGERTVGILTQTDLLEHYRDWAPLTI
jgi:acetoin utilization protein AcuB